MRMILLRGLVAAMLLGSISGCQAETDTGTKGDDRISSLLTEIAIGDAQMVWLGGGSVGLYRIIDIPPGATYKVSAFQYGYKNAKTVPAFYRSLEDMLAGDPVVAQTDLLHSDLYAGDYAVLTNDDMTPQDMIMVLENVGRSGRVLLTLQNSRADGGHGPISNMADFGDAAYGTVVDPARDVGPSKTGTVWANNAAQASKPLPQDQQNIVDGATLFIRGEKGIGEAFADEDVELYLVSSDDGATLGYAIVTRTYQDCGFAGETCFMADVVLTNPGGEVLEHWDRDIT